jgi:hypothetical protein
MDAISPEAFDFAMQKVRDGFTFEKFAQAFLSLIEGKEFTPFGGLKDRGMDGLEHSFTAKGLERTVYQTSIEEHAGPKLQNTIEKLKANGIAFEKLIYVTNRQVKDQDRLLEKFFDDHKVMVFIRCDGSA